MSDGLKNQFNELSSALTELHKALLMLEAKKLEGEMGRSITPYELLHASLHDPNLAWLRRLSALIVTIDTVIDETPQLSAQEANQVASAVLTVIEKPSSLIETDFWAHYSDYLHSNPDVIMLHSRVKTLLMNLRPQM